LGGNFETHHKRKFNLHFLNWVTKSISRGLLT
jgi:hypothetical protein